MHRPPSSCRTCLKACANICSLCQARDVSIIYGCRPCPSLHRRAVHGAIYTQKREMPHLVAAATLYLVAPCDPELQHITHLGAELLNMLCEGHASVHTCRL